MGGNTIARQMLDNMLGLQIPSKFQESVDLLTLKTRAAIPSSSASSDGASDDELAALCWCCRRHATPPRVGTCHHCGHLMRHSYVSFEVIPLVEFKPADDISVDEAIRLIESVPFFEKTEGAGKYGEGGAQIMQINGSNNVDYNDPFVNRMDEDSDLPLVVCNRQELIALNPTSILVVKRPAPLATQFLRNMLPDIFVTLCDNCQKTFYMEDYEMHLITKGCCPFCRYKKSESDEEDGDMDAMFDGNVLNGHSSISSKSSPFHTPEFK